MRFGNIELKHGLLLAPMAGYSDRAMRILAKKYGAEYSVTEMVSAKAVVYKATTPYFLEIAIDQKRYSGLSTYIPSPTADKELVEYYSKFKWSKDTGYLAAEPEQE